MTRCSGCMESWDTGPMFCMICGEPVTTKGKVVAICGLIVLMGLSMLLFLW